MPLNTTKLNQTNQKGLFCNKRNNKHLFCLRKWVFKRPDMTTIILPVSIRKFSLNLDDQLISIFIVCKLQLGKILSKLDKNYLNTSIRKHLRQFGIVSKLGQWIPHHMSATQFNQRVTPLIANLSRIDWSLLMKSGFSKIISNESNKG